MYYFLFLVTAVLDLNMKINFKMTNIFSCLGILFQPFIMYCIDNVLNTGLVIDIYGT